MGELIFIIILFVVIPRVIRSLTSKNRQGTSRSQQMVDEQKRKREEFEAQQQQWRQRNEYGPSHPSQQQDTSPYRRVADPYDDTPPYRREVDPYEDVPPYQRPSSPYADSPPVRRAVPSSQPKEVVRRTPSGQTYRAPVRSAASTEETSIKPQIKPAMVSSLSQSYSDPEMCDHETLSGVPYEEYNSLRPQVAPSIQVQESGLPDARLRPNLRIGQKELIQGLVMAEILGPPRAKRRRIR